MSGRVVAKVVHCHPVGLGVLSLVVDEIALFEFSVAGSGLWVCHMIPGPVFAIAAASSGPYIDAVFHTLAAAVSRAHALLQKADLRHLHFAPNAMLPFRKFLLAHTKAEAPDEIEAVLMEVELIRLTEERAVATDDGHAVDAGYSP